MSRDLPQKVGEFMSTGNWRSSIWRADLLTAGALGGFVALAGGIGWLLDPEFSEAGLVAAGLLLALVPALLWLGFFYRRDRLEPEPKGLVVRVFMLGALLAVGAGEPLLSEVFAVDEWVPRADLGTRLLAGFLIVGMTQEFLKFAAVRFSVYQSDEYNGITDAIIYSTAAGIGYATALNVVFVVESGGVELWAGSLQITLSVIAHAGFAGVVGYFMGRERFSRMPAWWIPLGLVIAAALNAAFFVIRLLLVQGALGEPRRLAGLLLATGLTAVITAVLSARVRADNEELENEARHEA